MKKPQPLRLGWCQGYMGLQFHMEKALQEAGLSPDRAVPNPPFALFARQYLAEIAALDHDKKHDYCFIGSISPAFGQGGPREWVRRFPHFSENSVFANTDKTANWPILGNFDLTGMEYAVEHFSKPEGDATSQYRDVQQNRVYFETMCQSRFVLCPAGDAPWSFRFYETIMCGSLPVVDSPHHTYRTREEALLDYRYVIAGSSVGEEDYNAWVRHNTALLWRHHTLGGGEAGPGPGPG